MLTTRNAPRAFRPALATALLALLAAPLAGAQEITVLPVTVQMAPGENAASLTIQNPSEHESTFQIRPYLWSEQAGADKLDPTDALMISPPLGTIPAGGTQTVRFVLRQPAADEEATYRVLIDQIPPAPEAGNVRIALRLSIPVFAEPKSRVAPHLKWSVEDDGGRTYLVASNNGKRHETIRNIVLKGPGGATLKVEGNTSPYVLAGATRRWQVTERGFAPVSGGNLHLSAHADMGTIDQTIPLSRGYR